jgi:ATP-binding cassette subfamily G (WHITE) protein 2 (SNQ2)
MIASLVYSIFFLFLFIMSLTMKGWFRAIAAAFPSEAAAQSFAGISTLALSIYTGRFSFRSYSGFVSHLWAGYSIPKPTMIGALRWLTYINVSFI